VVPSQYRNADHDFLSQRASRAGVEPPRNTQNEANMRFLFWLPMVVMCGMVSVFQDNARALLPENTKR
jgi:hypothetical protein